MSKEIIMKKLLAIGLLFSFTSYIDARTYELERGIGFTVRCINDFVFVQTKEGAITQMWLTGDIPMRCKAYRNVRTAVKSD